MYTRDAVAACRRRNGEDLQPSGTAGASKNGPAKTVRKKRSYDVYQQHHHQSYDDALDTICVKLIIISF